MSQVYIVIERSICNNDASFIPKKLLKNYNFKHDDYFSIRGVYSTYGLAMSKLEHCVKTKSHGIYCVLEIHTSRLNANNNSDNTTSYSSEKVDPQVLIWDAKLNTCETIDSNDNNEDITEISNSISSSLCSDTYGNTKTTKGPYSSRPPATALKTVAETNTGETKETRQPFYFCKKCFKSLYFEEEFKKAISRYSKSGLGFIPIMEFNIFKKEFREILENNQHCCDKCLRNE